MTLAQTTPTTAANTTPAPAPTTVASTPPPSAPPATVGKGAYVPEPTHEIPEAVDPRLVTILSWPRAHNSYTELQFCKWVRDTAKELGGNPIVRSEGCISVTVPRPAAAPAKPSASTTLFSCHLDTVDATVALAAGLPDRKKLVYDPIFGHITLDKDSIGGCLGADDGAGVWLMLGMIERKVPGTYLFHRGEECSGIGSKAMASKEKEWLGQFECAVAFDRAGTSEVITHQRGKTKCASAKFGEALASRLTDKGMSYRTSDGGSFTDVYEYRRIIPECVNLAVGYESQHGRSEMLDYAHLCALLDAVCAIDWDSLPIDRDASEPDPTPQWGNAGRGWGSRASGHPHSQGGLFLGDDDDGFTPHSESKTVSPFPTTPTTRPHPAPKLRSLFDDSLRSMDYAELVDYLEAEDMDTIIDGIVELRLALARAEAERDEYKHIGGFSL